jgi:cytochrome c biogenesis protein CcmG, thiol:disulfide interchange protein DsbE
MPMNRVASSLAVAALVVLAPRWTAGAPPTHTPHVVLQQADGTPVPLAAYEGKVLLIDFWASWCIPCKTSFPALDAIFREYQARGLEVLAVNLDEERRQAGAFLAAHPHQMPVLFDPKGAAPLAFGVKGMPTSFLIDKTGAIRFTHTGYSGNVDVRYRQEIAQLLSEK